MKVLVSLTVSLSFAICALAQDPALTSVSVAYQVNQAHTGNVQVSGLTLPLKLKWSVNLNGNASYPLIIPGEVVVIDGGNGTVPSTLEALSSTDGSLLWSQPVASGYGGWIGAAYDNGVVFANNYETPGFSSGSMSAFNATTGELLWTASLPGQYLFTSPATAQNGIVYTGGAGGGGTVYALSETNGDLLWTGSVENGDTSAPAISSTGVYVSYACPQSYRFNSKTGAQVWHYSGACEGGGGDTAVVYKGLVYVRDVFSGSTNGLTLNAATGAQVGGFNSQYAPAFSGTTAFYTESNSLTAVNLTTGATLWTVNPTGSTGFTCSPIVVNGIVYMGTSTSTLLGYSAATGKQKVSMTLSQSISCSEYFVVPQAGMGAGQGLLVVPAGTELYAFE
jgi:outer membrane protein assembly factor BamB